MNAHDLFEILVREHSEMLMAFLRAAVRDTAAIDDLFQDTMLTAWRRLDEFDRTRPFGPWLRGIAAKLVLAHRRKSARAVILCDEDVLEQLDRQFERMGRRTGDTWDDRLDGLRDCLQALPEHYREPVQMRYRDELPATEVAVRLHMPLETVKKRLQRARAILLDCLERKLSAAEATS